MPFYSSSSIDVSHARDSLSCSSNLLKMSLGRWLSWTPVTRIKAWAWWRAPPQSGHPPQNDSHSVVNCNLQNPELKQTFAFMSYLWQAFHYAMHS